MAQSRGETQGKTLHVYNKGANGKKLFFQDMDYEYMCDVIRRKAEQHGVILVDYAIMPNHYHFLLIPLYEKSLEKFMQGIGTIYARYYNRVTHNTGPVFNGRYKSKEITTEQYYQVVKEYIWENPKTVGLVKNSKDWKYCSASTGPINEMPVLEQFNAELNLYDRVKYSGLYKQIPEKLRHKVVIGEFRTSESEIPDGMGLGTDSSFFLG